MQRRARIKSKFIDISVYFKIQWFTVCQTKTNTLGAPEDRKIKIMPGFFAFNCDKNVSLMQNINQLGVICHKMSYLPRWTASLPTGKRTTPPHARLLNPGILNSIAFGWKAINDIVCLETRKCFPWWPVTLPIVLYRVYRHCMTNSDAFFTANTLGQSQEQQVFLPTREAW